MAMFETRRRAIREQQQMGDLGAEAGARTMRMPAVQPLTPRGLMVNQTNQRGYDGRELRSRHFQLQTTLRDQDRLERGQAMDMQQQAFNQRQDLEQNARAWATMALNEKDRRFDRAMRRRQAAISDDERNYGRDRDTISDIRYEREWEAERGDKKREFKLKERQMALAEEKATAVPAGKAPGFKAASGVYYDAAAQGGYSTEGWVTKTMKDGKEVVTYTDDAQRYQGYVEAELAADPNRSPAEISAAAMEAMGAQKGDPAQIRAMAEKASEMLCRGNEKEKKAAQAELDRLQRSYPWAFEEEGEAQPGDQVRTADGRKAVVMPGGKGNTAAPQADAEASVVDQEAAVGDPQSTLPVTDDPQTKRTAVKPTPKQGRVNPEFRGVNPNSPANSPKSATGNQDLPAGGRTEQEWVGISDRIKGGQASQKEWKEWRNEAMKRGVPVEVIANYQQLHNAGRKERDSAAIQREGRTRAMDPEWNQRAMPRSKDYGHWQKVAQMTPEQVDEMYANFTPEEIESLYQRWLSGQEQ